MLGWDIWRLFWFLTAKLFYFLFRGNVYILLKRELKEHNFINCAYTLKWYLEKILESDPSSCSLDLSSLTKNISSWTFREIELLSEMTLESMQELFSTLFKYDERCNEIFFQELPSDLKKFKVGPHPSIIFVKFYEEALLVVNDLVS